MPELKPRRRPARASGQSIVTAILDAASALLVESGIEGITTNAIAKRAGISVGSLYQYFPNKEAICAGIAKRVNERLLAQLKVVVSNELSAAERLDGVIDVVCSDAIGSFDVRRALLLHVPRTWDETHIASTEQQASEITAPLFRALASGFDPQERAERQALAFFAVRGAVQGLLLHAPGLLSEPRTRARMRGIVMATLRP